MIDEFIVAGFTQIGEALQHLKSGETILVSPPYLSALVDKAADERLELEVEDGGLFYYVSAKQDES